MHFHLDGLRRGRAAPKQEAFGSQAASSMPGKRSGFAVSALSPARPRKARRWPGWIWRMIERTRGGWPCRPASRRGWRQRSRKPTGPRLSRNEGLAGEEQEELEEFDALANSRWAEAEDLEEAYADEGSEAEWPETEERTEAEELEGTRLESNWSEHVRDEELEGLAELGLLDMENGPAKAVLLLDSFVIGNDTTSFELSGPAQFRAVTAPPFPRLPCCLR